jgi:F0F1-type ATP synthase membrane subunit b/b'
VEKDIKDKERLFSSLEEGISERKAALLKARQSSEEIDSIINDLKEHIGRLKDEEKELTNSL